MSSELSPAMGSVVRTVTESIETSVSVAAVLDVLCDPTSIPTWAPVFADRISGDPPSGWVAVKDGRAFAIRVAADRSTGTVDYLREVAPGREGGAYIRAIPRPGGGTVIVMTLPHLADVDAAATRATLREELAGLTSLLERD